MHIGGVILGAGMELNLIPGDYLYGDLPIRFLLEEVIEVRSDWGTEWIIMSGRERPSATRPWRPRRVQVRVSALSRSLALVT